MWQHRLARFEPLSRMLDPFVVSSMIIKNPAIGPYLPQTLETLYFGYAVPIDTSCTAQVVEKFNRIPGLTTVAADAVTVNRRSCMLYSTRKGDVSLFETMSQLKSKVHNTEAEIEDACVRLRQIIKKYGSTLCNIGVDNGGYAVIAAVIKILEKEFPLLCLLLTRDPGHCTDLMAKDLAKACCLAATFEQAKAVVALMSLDAVKGIVDELVDRSAIQRQVAWLLCE